jgi:hypothetical protein
VPYYGALHASLVISKKYVEVRIKSKEYLISRGYKNPNMNGNLFVPKQKKIYLKLLDAVYDPLEMNHVTLFSVKEIESIAVRRLV